MANNLQTGSAGDRFRRATEARVAFLTNTTEIGSPEAAEEYIHAYDAAMTLGGLDMRTVVLPRVNPDTLVLFDEGQLQNVHGFMGRVALETAPSGVHMPFAQRQQYAAGLHAFRSKERRGVTVGVGAKAGGLAVIGVMQDSTMADHYADTLAVLGSEWDGSWATTDLRAVAFNGAAVRNLRACMGDMPNLVKMHEHKLIGPTLDRVVTFSDEGSAAENASLAISTSIVGANEYAWLESARETTGLSSLALMGIAADAYGSRMRLRGSRNWMRLFSFYKNLDIPPAPHEETPLTPQLTAASLRF